MKDIFYQSSNKIDTIHASIWECENPKFVLQVVHGMQEHIGRYGEFAKFLNQNNIIMAGEDHLGHGKSTNNLGDFGSGDTINYVIKDVNTLHENLKSIYKIPVYILGHSMGSFITRYYISQYAVDKVIIMGTGNTPSFLAKLLISIATVQEKIYGTNHRSNFLTSLTTGSFVKNTKNGHWISYNEKNAIDYANDPLCGFKFTPSGFKFLGKILNLIQQQSTFSNVSNDTKILLISGKDDAVGANNSVEKVYTRYKKLGYDVNMHLFENMRHEILNEDNKEYVWNFIKDFLS